MKKKEYIKPQMNVFKADTQAILASTMQTIRLERASEADYTDDNNIKNLWDSEKTKTIWAD